MPPSVRSTGAVSTAGTTSPHSVPRPGTVTAGDVLIAVLEIGAASAVAATGWTELALRSQAAATGSTILVAMGKIAEAGVDDAGGSVSFTITGAVNHISGRMIAIQDHGCSAITDLVIGTITGGAQAGASPQTNTIPGITVVANSMILMVAGDGLDVSNTTTYSGWTNSNLTSITEIIDNHTTSGNGGGFGVATGLCAGTTTGSSTYTQQTLYAWNALHIGVPPVPAGNNFSQPHFRIRSDDTESLNADAGWAAVLDADAIIDVEKVFRVRFEVENNGAAVNAGFKLQYRKNGGGWLDVPVSDSQTAPTIVEEVEIVPSNMYADGDATTNLLAGSAVTFAAGSGEENNATAAWNQGSRHGEFEWALRIRKLWGTFADGTLGQNLDGDTFEFRVVSISAGAFSGTYEIPIITANVPAKLIGGTFVEAPNFVGPFKDANGNLYVVIEVSDMNPRLCVVKSTDNGESWVGQDLTGSPSRRDAEAVSVVQVGSELFILHQQSSTVSLHTFRTSDNATPDTWNIKNEDVDQVVATNDDQFCSLVRRSDGTYVALYESDVTVTGSFRRIGYRIRSTVPAWGSEVLLDTTASTHFTHATAVTAESDEVWIFYKDHSNGVLYYKTLSSAGVLSSRTQVATGLSTAQAHERPIVAAVYFNDAGEENVVVVYLKNDDKLYCRWIREGVMDAEIAVTSETVNVDPSSTTLYGPVASIALKTKSLYVFYADAATADIWYRVSNDGAAFGSATEVVDGVNAEGIQSLTYDQTVGYVYDDGTGGHTGTVKFNRLSLAQIIAMGMVTETDSAQAISERKTRVLGQPSTTDTAFAMSKKKSRTLAQSTETDTAQLISEIKRRAFGQASETDTAQAVAKQKRRTMAQASETDSALTLTKFVQQFLNQVEETDEAQPFSSAKRRLMDQALQTNVAQPFSEKKTRLMGQAIELDFPVPYDAVILRDGPIGYWKLDDPSPTAGSNAVDSSVNARHGVYRQTPSAHAGIIPNAPGAIDFSSDFIDVADNNDLSWQTAGAISAEIWLQPEVDHIGQIALSKGVTGAHEWRLSFVTGVLGFRIFGSGTTVVYEAQWPGELNIGDTYHIVGTFDGFTCRIFVNGVEGIPNTIASGTPTANGTGMLTIGAHQANPPTGTNFINGKMARVAVYPYALEAEQIDDHYRIGFGTVVPAKSKLMAQAEETDTALVFSRLQSFTIGIATENDLAQTITAARFLALAQAVENDLAMVLSEKKLKAMGQASETDTANELDEFKRRILNQVIETDTAHQITARRILAFSQATETDLAQAFAEVKRRVFAQALETDTAQSLTELKRKSFAQAIETDLAQAFQEVKRRVLGQPVETDSAFALSVVLGGVLGIAEESDISFAMTERKARLIGQVTETDTAQTIIENKMYTMGLALEADSAFAFTKSKRRTLNMAVESDIAQLIRSSKVKLIAMVQEVDSSRSLVVLKTRRMDQAVEFDTAGDVSAISTFPMGQAVEVDSALEVDKVKTIVLGQAVEFDEALEIVRGFAGKITAIVEVGTATAVVKKVHSAIVDEQTVEAKVR